MLSVHDDLTKPFAKQHSRIDHTTPTEEEKTISPILTKTLGGFTLMFGGLFDAYPFMDGLAGMPTTNIAGCIPNSTAATWGISAAYFAQSCLYNSTYTFSGITQLQDCFKGKLPSEWNKLSTNKKIAVGFISGLQNAYAIFSDTIGSIYFLTQLGWNNTFSYIFGTLASASNLPTECRESFLTLCQKFSNDTLEEAKHTDENSGSSLAKSAYDGVKFLFKFISSFEDGIESYIFMAAMFAITAPAAQWSLFFLSATSFINSYYYDGKNSGAALDQMIEKLSHGIPELKSLLIFLASVIPAVVVCDVKRNLSTSLLTDPNAPLPFFIPNWFITTLSWGCAIPTAINFTAATYPLIKSGVDHAIKKTTNCIRAHQYSGDFDHQHAINFFEAEEDCHLTTTEAVINDDYGQEEVLLLTLQDSPYSLVYATPITNESEASTDSRENSSPSDCESDSSDDFILLKADDYSDDDNVEDRSFFSSLKVLQNFSVFNRSKNPTVTLEPSILNAPSPTAI